MVAVRRWYQYLVSFISLQAVVWAIIYLVRDLLTPGAEAPNEALAFQIAVIVVGLPLFLAHWLWAQRLATSEADERASALRRLYLYGILAAFLIPLLANGYALIETLLRMGLGEPLGPFGQAWGTMLLRNLIALVVLALFSAYHYRILQDDRQHAGESPLAATLRRLFLFAFSAVGLTLTLLALIHLLRWLLYQVTGQENGLLAPEIARLLVGLPLWLLCWSQAQQQFLGGATDAQASTVRKLYLYLVIFVSVVATVSHATLILAGFLRALLGLPSTGDLREPLPVVLIMLVPWLYHTVILRQDERLTPEAPRQATVRRIYLYLVAAIGLSAFLLGVSGVVNVLLDLLEGLGEAEREMLAISVAALLAGLPVWFFPWRQAQQAASREDEHGAAERRALTRKLYLYFFLFVATMVALGSVIFIVYQLLFRLLGGQEPLTISEPLAFTLIALGVWWYHGRALWADHRRLQVEQQARLEQLHVAVVDDGDGALGQALLLALRQALPTLTLSPWPLSVPAAEAMGVPLPDDATPLAEVDLIVGPWTLTRAAPGLEEALASSPARKLLIPTWREGWEWVGVPRESADESIEQAVRSIQQIAAGEQPQAGRGLSIGAIALLVLGGFFFLFVLLPFLFGLLTSF